MTWSLFRHRGMGVFSILGRVAPVVSTSTSRGTLISRGSIHLHLCVSGQWIEETAATILHCCLLLIDKARAKDKTDI